MPKVRIGDLDMYYEEAGEGPPLVLLHGLGASLEDWEYQVPDLSKYFRVITPDLRGFGRSARGSLAASIPCFARDVAGLLEHLGVREFFLMGYSMGGATALQLTLDNPKAVTRLIIANSVPTFRPQTLRQHFEVWYRMVVMSLLGPVRLARISAMRMFPHQPEVRERNIARGIAYNTRRTYLSALSALTQWSVLDRLRELSMPVLVIAAEHDYFSREDTLKFAHALPKGRLHVFPDTHHGLPMEKPGPFNWVVLKFLRSKR